MRLAAVSRGPTILGLDPIKDGATIRARLGVVPQLDTLDFELTVRENVIIYGRYFGLSRSELCRRADELLEFVQLDERADSRVEPLSGGMKRRLTIARSLVNDPDLLLLDEPTTGLDPQARHLVWDRLFRLKQGGATVSSRRTTWTRPNSSAIDSWSWTKAGSSRRGSPASSSFGTRPERSSSLVSVKSRQPISACT